MKAWAEGASSRLKKNIPLSALTLLAIILAFQAGRDATLGIVSGADAALALSLSPTNAQALARSAEAELERSAADPRRFEKAEILARSALKSQAVLPSALRILGFVSAERGDAVAAQRLLVLSSSTSRRDFGTQLWLIEAEVENGNARSALRHYDNALRTNSRSGTILYPTLLSALDNEEIRSLMIPYVRKPTPWMAEFFGNALASGEPLNSLARLAIKSRRVPSSTAYPDQKRRLLEHLVDKNETELALTMFLVLHPGKKSLVQSVAMDEPSFAADNAPMGWQLKGDDGWGSSRSDTKGIQLFAGSSEQGVVARRILFLDDGKYQLAIRYGNAQFAANGNIGWRLACRSTPDEMSFFKSMPIAVQTAQVMTYDVEINVDCPMQVLEAVISGGDSQTGSEVEIESIAMTRSTPS